MNANILKYKYVLVLTAMAIWVYVVPLHFGNIDEIGMENSNQYFSVNKSGMATLISSSTIERNKYLDTTQTLRIAIDSLNEVPQQFIDCIITQEDRGFFTNPLGINVRGLARAFTGGGGGGSGIYQQTVKNIFFTSDQTIVTIEKDSTGKEIEILKQQPEVVSNLNRKLAEILLTINFSRNYSREEILRTYLNNAYFAHTSHGKIYGLKLAAQYHFNKPLNKLTLTECTLLAKFFNKPYIVVNKDWFVRKIANGEIKKTTLLNDYLAGKISTENYKIEVLKGRRETLLNDLVKVGKIDEKNKNETLKEDIKLVQDIRLIDEDDRLKTERGFIELARQEKDKILKTLDLKNIDGLKIYTTMNGNLQRAIQDVYFQVNKNWKDSIMVKVNRKGKDTLLVDNLQCAVFCIDKNTGAVLGLLDGRTDFKKNWNNYCFTKRPAGSIFKIFDYYTLFQNQPTFTDSTLVPDLKLPNKRYPLSHTLNKNIPIRQAVSISSNIVPFNLVYNNLISLPQIQGIASLFGVNIADTESFGTLIGQDDVSLVQMVNAYNTVSNQGYKKENYYISKITDRKGKVLYEKVNENNIHQITLNSAACRKLKNCFNGVINTGGTASFIARNPKVQPNDINFGGKTGTTDNATNLWYMGYTPEFTMGIWQGYTLTNNRKAGNAGSDCANIWNKILTTYNGK
jgi:membrane peptidoglycan carboxypeptidase